MSKAVAPRTNGDRIEQAVDRAKKKLAGDVAWAREHPDEAAVRALPVLVAFRLSFKYDMDLIDHMLITQLGFQFGDLALKAYREWKARPARPPLKEVI